MPIRYRALIPAVGWSVVSWYGDGGEPSDVVVVWDPVVVWAIRAAEHEAEDDRVVPLRVEPDDVTELWDVTQHQGLGLYPTAQQDDPDLAAALLTEARAAMQRHRTAQAPRSA